ncbi:hypothetical protein CBR_g8466 [Chara braunii]|uniref:SAWADEE domain-containing protein n=1 Tax=Chara braunii TaxID=69332 RepID=A0A388KM78_CHABU|nr:hypothetical protein CBR_g8466 [Chara braunii]|eukprot:GBG71164.1 hypothetical protein CBR_g8466 [Chara braunii]
MERGTGSQFRFLPRETAEMEALYNSSSNGQLGRSDVEALAAKFSAAPERAGQKPITCKQVLNWFQYKRHNMRMRGALKNDSELQQQKQQHPASKQPSSDGLARTVKEETPTPASSGTGGRTKAQTSAAAPDISAAAATFMGRQGQGGVLANESGGRGVVPAAGTGDSIRVGGFSAPTGSGLPALPQYMDYEAKSARDGAWYDVEKFVGWRDNESGEREVKVRFTGFGQEEDEWVHADLGLRQRSLPCEGSECIGVLPNDLVLCFQEGNDQALYYDADVLDVERRQHDVRGCRCRFCVRYRHDLQEEIVPLRKICRRPETEYRLHMARMGGLPLQPSLASAAARLAMAPLAAHQVQQQLQQQKRQQLQQQQRQQQLLLQQRKNQSLAVSAVPAVPQILSQATVAPGAASDGATSLAMPPTHLQAALASMPSVPTLVTSPTPFPLPSLSLPSLAPVVSGSAPQLGSGASPPPAATAPAFLSTNINGGGNGTTAIAGVVADTLSSMSSASVASTSPLTPVTASSLASLPAGTAPASTAGASLSLGTGTLSPGQNLFSAGKSQPTATASAKGPTGGNTSNPAAMLPSASGSLLQQAAVSVSDASASNGQETAPGLKRARPDMLGGSGTGSSSTGSRGRGFLAAASVAVSNLTAALQQTVAGSDVSGNKVVDGMTELKRVKLERGGTMATPAGLGAAHGAGSAAAASGIMQSMSPSLSQLSMSGTPTVGRGLISTGSGMGATGSQLVGTKLSSHQLTRTGPLGSTMPSVVAAPGRVVLPQTMGSSESFASRASDNNSKRLRIDNTGLASMGSGAVATHAFSWAPAGMQSLMGGPLMKGLNKGGGPLTGGQTGVARSVLGSGSPSSTQTDRIGHSFGSSVPLTSAGNPALPQQAVPSSVDMLRTRVQDARTGVKKSRSGPDSMGMTPLPSAGPSGPGPHGNGIHNPPVVGLKRPKLEMVDSESMTVGMASERISETMSVAMMGLSSAAGEAVGVTANGFPGSSTRLGGGEGIAIRGVSGGAGAQGGRAGGVADGVGTCASLSLHSSVAGCPPGSTPASCAGMDASMDASMAASTAFPVTSSLHIPMPSGDTGCGKAKNPTWTESPRDFCLADSLSPSITTSPMVQSSAAMDSNLPTLAVGSSASDDPLLAKGNLVQDVAQLGLTQRLETSGSASSCEIQMSGNADRSTSSITVAPSSSSSSPPPALSVSGGNVMQFVVESPD